MFTVNDLTFTWCSFSSEAWFTIITVITAVSIDTNSIFITVICPLCTFIDIWKEVRRKKMSITWGCTGKGMHAVFVAYKYSISLLSFRTIYMYKIRNTDNGHLKQVSGLKIFLSVLLVKLKISVLFLLYYYITCI